MQHNTIPQRHGNGDPSEDFNSFWSVYTAALMARDVDRVLACYADDVVYDESPMMMSTPLIGKDSCRKYWTRVFDAFSSVRIVTTRVALHGDQAWVQWTMHNFHAPTAKAISIHGVLLLTLRDGRMVHEKLYWDRARLECDLGSWGRLARIGIAVKVLLSRCTRAKKTAHA